MKTTYLLLSILLLTSCSEYCDECVDPDVKITTTGSEKAMDITLANIGTDQDDWFIFAFTTTTDLESLSVSFNHNGKELSAFEIDQDFIRPGTAGFGLELDSLYTVKIPMNKVLNENPFPIGLVDYTVDIITAVGTLKVETGIYFYNCMDFDNDFDFVDCRYFCQIHNTNDIDCGCP